MKKLFATTTAVVLVLGLSSLGFAQAAAEKGQPPLPKAGEPASMGKGPAPAAMEGKPPAPGQQPPAPKASGPAPWGRGPAPAAMEGKPPAPGQSGRMHKEMHQSGKDLKAKGKGYKHQKAHKGWKQGPPEGKPEAAPPVK